MSKYGYGPNLQVAMFETGATPDSAEVERVVTAARALFLHVS
jgi:hypothetical protein